MYKSKGAKNIFFGISAQIITMLVGILLPRLVLVNLGSESNGLLGSVNSILGYMSLLEAGVGTATLQALYKPCATQDHEAINQIMSATNSFYRRTGKAYLSIVLILSIGYTLFVNTDLPKISVFIVVLLNGLSGVISYFFQGKYRILLSAEGKSYVNSNIATIIHIISSLVKAILLVLGIGIVGVQISAFVCNIAQMIVYVLYIRKNYAWLDTTVIPDFNAISQRNAVLVHQISGLIFSNTDVMLLTIFTSLKEVSVYTMYAMVFGMIKSLSDVIYDSYRYALGQSYNTNFNRFLKMFDAYEVITMMLTFSLYCVCRILMNPFLALYTDGVHDVAYVDSYLPWLFAVYYLLNNGRTASNLIINISQHFEDTKWRAILESMINLVVSVICVIKFGIYGVLFGTIAALLYRTNDMILYAARIINRSCLIAYKRWLINIMTFAILSLLFARIDIRVYNYFTFFTQAIWISVVVFVVFIIVNAISEWMVTKNVIHFFLKRL